MLSLKRLNYKGNIIAIYLYKLLTYCISNTDSSVFVISVYFKMIACIKDVSYLVLAEFRYEIPSTCAELYSEYYTHFFAHFLHNIGYLHCLIVNSVDKL